MPRLLALLLLMLVPSTGCGTRGRPALSSPTPEVVDGAIAAGSVIDPVSAEPVWYDPNVQQVLRWRDGVVAPVQDRTFELPFVLRVLDDDTVVMSMPGVGMVVHPPTGAPVVFSNASSFDGIDLGSLWFVATPERGSASLCRALPDGGRDCVADIALEYSPGPLGVAADGNVYLSIDGMLYRWDGTTLRALEATSPATGFRHGVGPGLLLVTYTDVLAVEGDTMRPVFELAFDRAVVSGSPDHFVVGILETETSRTCNGDWFGSACTTREVWSQWVFTEVRAGEAREIGHQDCVHAEGTPSCAWTTEALALEEATVVIAGDPFRMLAL